MKRSVLLLILIVSPMFLFSQTGIGIILGEPTGLTIKSWTGATTAVDLALAYSFSDRDHFYVHMNFLRHRELQIDQTTIPWYWGLGANVRYREGANDEVKLAGRIPFGIYHMFDDFPADIFLEIAPALNVVPDLDFYLGAAIGFRLYIF